MDEYLIVNCYRHWLLPIYSGDLNNGLVWYLNGPNMSDRQMVFYSNHDLNTGLFVHYSGQGCLIHDLNNGLLVRYSGHGLNNRLFVWYSGHGLNNGLVKVR